MRVVNPAAPARVGREGTRRGVGPRRERGRPARMPRRQAQFPGMRAGGRRPALPRFARGVAHVNYVKWWSGNTFIFNSLYFFHGRRRVISRVVSCENARVAGQADLCCR